MPYNRGRKYQQLWGKEVGNQHTDIVDYPSIKYGLR